MLRWAVTGLLLYLSMQTVAALDGDASQPTFLDADDVEINVTERVRIYRGNVVLIQGSVRLNCDKLVTSLDENQALEEAVCTGDPARFKQRPADQDEDIRLSALKITLDQTNDLLILENRATMEQGGSLITGNRAVYNRATREARITGDQAVQSGDGSEPQDHSRVKTVIQPRKKESG